jgi:hypothetical protein
MNRCNAQRVAHYHYRATPHTQYFNMKFCHVNTCSRIDMTVEHDLAHGSHWQSNRARYTGQRKNRFGLRSCAVVQNLHVLVHADRLAKAA